MVESMASRAGLQFPVGNMHSVIKNTFANIKVDATVALASVLEFMTAEVLRLAAEDTKNTHKVARILPTNIQMAMRGDAQISNVISTTLFPPVPTQEDKERSEKIHSLETSFSAGEIAEEEYKKRKVELDASAPAPLPSFPSLLSLMSASSSPKPPGPPPPPMLPSNANYIFKVLKKVDSNMGISRKGMAVTESFVADIYKASLSTAVHFTPEGGSITSVEIIKAVRFLIAGSLGQSVITFVLQTLQKYKQRSEELAINPEDATESSDNASEAIPYADDE